MFETLDRIDEVIFLTLHKIARGEFMDSAMWLSSDRWIWIPMYAVLAWWIIRSYGWKRGVILIVAVGAAVTCADQLCAKVLRPLAERMRPANLDNPLSTFVYIVRDYRGGNFGFPSCHAANTFVLASFTAMMCRGRGATVWMFAWALLNCFSRIYLGVHYPGDLLVGAIVGTTSGVLWWYAVNMVNQRVYGRPVERRKVEWNVPYAVAGYLTVGIIVLISIF